MKFLKKDNLWYVEGFEAIGYKTTQMAAKAYHKHKTDLLKKEYENLNPEIKELFEEYFSEKAFITRLKNNVRTSFDTMLKTVDLDILETVKKNKHLWEFKLERTFMLW